MREPNLEPDSPKVCSTCSECGQDIYDGEDYIETIEGDICLYCAKDMPCKDLLRLVEVEIKTAGRSESEDGIEGLFGVKKNRHYSVC